MALHLLLARQPPERKAVILADPAAPAGADGGIVEALLAGLVSQLGAVERVIYPLPDDTTRRHRAPASLTRSRHADLWNALSEDERGRVLLVAGPTAAYLAPVIGSAATALVAVRDPSEGTASRGAWRFALGPFAELDEVPEEAESEEERERWLDRVRAATSQLELVRVSDVEAVTRELAIEVGLGPKAATRAATVAASANIDAEGSRRSDKPVHWLDEALYSLSRPSEQPRSRKRRQSAGASARADDAPRKAQRPGKRRQRSPEPPPPADEPPPRQRRSQKRRRGY